MSRKRANTRVPGAVFALIGLLGRGSIHLHFVFCGISLGLCS
jgi:hypothetical protein